MHRVEMTKRCRVFSKMREIGAVLEVDEPMYKYLMNHSKAKDYIVVEKQQPSRGRGRPRKNVIQTPEDTYNAIVDNPVEDDDASASTDS